MKRIILSLLLLTGLLGSCMNDDLLENTDTMQTKQFYLQKSKEFAEKYNVPLSLNEENLDVIISSMSIQQIEKDFARFSDLSISYKSEVNSSKSKKMRIRRKISFLFTCR